MHRTFDRTVASSIFLLVAALAIGAFVNSRNIHSLNEDVRKVAQTHQVRELISRSQRYIAEAVANQRTFLLTGGRDERTAFKRSLSQLRDTLVEVKRQTKDNLYQYERALEVSAAADSLANELQLGLEQQSQQHDSSKPVDLAGTNAAFARIEAATKAMVDEESRLLDERRTRANDAYHTAAVSVAGAIALGLTLFWLVLRLIRRNVKNQAIAADALQVERNRLRVTLDSIADAVIAVDADERVTYVNRIAEQLTGWSSQEALGQPLDKVYQVVHEQTRTPIRRSLDMLTRNGAPFERTDSALLVARDGAEKPITESTARIKTDHGRPTGAVIAFRDLSEQRRHSLALHEREDRIRLLLDSTAEGIYGIDVEGRCTFANAASARLLGYSEPDEMLGKSMHDLIHHSRPDGTPLPRSECRIQRTLASGEEMRADDEHFWRVDGAAIPVEYRSHPIHSNGQVVGAAVTFLDVTERKRMDHVRAERARMAVLRVEVAAHLAKNDDQSEAILHCVQSIVRRTKALAAQVWTIDEDQFAANLQAGAGLELRELGKVGPAADATLGQIEKALAPFAKGGLRTDSRMGAISCGDSTSAATFAAFPLEIEGQQIGVLGVFSKEDLSPRESEELKQLADQLAQFIVRRRAVEALAENERQFRQMADSIPQLAWMARPDGSIFWFNQRWFDFTGASLDEMQGSGWQSVLDPAEAPRIQESMRRSLATGRPWEEAFALRRKDGAYRWCLSRMLPIRDDDGKINRWFGTNTDITEQREAEQAREESERRFRELAESMPQIVWVTDPQGRYEYYNQRWFDYTGGFRDEQDSSSWNDRIHPDDREKAITGWKQALETGAPYELEYRLRGADEDYRWFLRRAIPIYGDSGEILRWIGTSTDIHHRKKVEEERELFEFLIENSRDFIGICDLNGQSFFINPAGAELVGLDSTNSQVRMDVRDFFYPEDVAYVVEEFFPKIAQHGPSAIEIRFRHFKTGLPIWMAYSVMLVRDPAGRPIGYATVSRNISESRRAAEELKASQQFLQSTMNSLSSHIAVLDENGVILAVNDAWRSFADASGLTSEHYGVGDNYLNTYVPVQGSGQDGPDVSQNIRDVIQGAASSFVLEYPSHGPYEQRWFLMRVTRFPGPGPSRVVVAHEDISSRVRSEQETLQRSEQLRWLADVAVRITPLNTVSEILSAVTDAAGSIIGAQQAAAIRTPANPREKTEEAYWLGDKHRSAKKLKALYLPYALCRTVYEHNATVRLTPAEVALELDAVKDGGLRETVPNGWLAVPLMGISGRNMGLLQLSDKREGDFTADDEAILVQLAQMASAAIENVRLYTAVKDSDTRKDQFLAMLAHELRNPLAPLSAAIELIQLEPAVGSEIESYADMASRQCEQLRRLIDDLLDVSRITTGKLRLQLQPVDLNAAVSSAIDMSRPMFVEARHEFSSSLPDEPAFVNGDTTRLSQIIANLLINAAKYTPEGGRIELAVTHSGDTVRLDVKDDGIGIPADRLDEIFELFAQVDNSSTRSQGGLGIGLTLVKTLVEMHGGAISVASDGQGCGSCFTITLPATVEPALLDAEHRPAPLDAFRILVVDDNRSALLLVRRLLEKLGQKVEVCNLAPEALKMMETHCPDVVMSDVAMPEMSGYDLARAIRELPLAKQPVLIALTGYGQETDRREALEAGFDEHLVKPVSLAALSAVLQRIPRLARSRRRHRSDAPIK